VELVLPDTGDLADGDEEIAAADPDHRPHDRWVGGAEMDDEVLDTADAVARPVHERTTHHAREGDDAHGRRGRGHRTER